MKQNLIMSPCDRARLKRRQNAGHTSYSPILIENKPVALAVFIAEDEILSATLEMAFAEKAEDTELPFFYVRHDPEFTCFQVTPGNIHAAFYFATTKTLTEDGLVKLFEYCRNN